MSPKSAAIGVVDYGMGNLRSVGKALESLGFPVAVTSDVSVLDGCRGVVLPGVGAFRDCMDNLRKGGLLPFLSDYLASDRPFLGICLGLQLLFSESEEFGRHEGLGFLPGKVVRFPAGMTEPRQGGGERRLKIPHMGWNRIDVTLEHPVLEGIPSGSHFYFVHSYFVAPADRSVVAATSSYGIDFTAAVASGNRLAVQFHPEKSQSAGLRLLSNFGRLSREAG